LAEGAAENVGIVSADGRLLFPGPGNILPGTTAERVMALAETLVARGGLVSVGPADIPMEAVRAAREMLIVGTTVDVAAAVEFDGKAVGDGKPGPAWRELSLLLEEDMRSNREVLTPVFE
jgi:branched-chain amino acid aminotransferase